MTLHHKVMLKINFYHNGRTCYTMTIECYVTSDTTNRFADLQNMVLDTTFISIGQLVSKLCSKYPFPVMAAAVAPYVCTYEYVPDNSFVSPGMVYQVPKVGLMHSNIKRDMVQKAKIVPMAHQGQGQVTRSNFF